MTRVGVCLVSLGALGAGCATTVEVSDAGTDSSFFDAASRDATSDVGRDASSSIDVGPDVFYDAGPDAHFFVMMPAPFEVSIERCGEIEGATAVVRVTTHITSSCDGPAPMLYTEDVGAHTITLTPQVWHEHGRSDCVDVDVTFTRELQLELPQGSWTILGAAMPLPLEIGPAIGGVTCPTPPAMGTVPLGDACRADCECTTGRCVALRGDATCARVCAQICEPIGWGPDVPLVIGTDEVCVDDPGLGFVARPRTTNECDDATPCPPGMACSAATDVPRVCVWTFSLPLRLTYAPGPPCSTQADCAAPLDCVERPGRRTCEVRCSTDEMLCPPSSYVCIYGVCESFLD